MANVVITATIVCHNNIAKQYYVEILKPYHWNFGNFLMCGGWFDDMALYVTVVCAYIYYIIG